MNAPLKRLGQVLLATSLLAGAQAFGQSTITLPAQTFVNVSDTATGDGTGGYALSFAQFNGALGTLTSVEIDFTNVTVSGTVTVQNGAGAPRTYTGVALVGNYYVSDFITATDPTTVGMGAPPDPTTSVGVQVSTTPVSSGSVTAGGSFTTNPSTSNPGSGVNTITNITTLALYTGTGSTTINLSLFSENTGTATGFGTFTVSELSSGSGTVDIIYTYTPVPEPMHTAGWMIAFGLCVLVGRNYLRRTTATPAV